MSERSHLDPVARRFRRWVDEALVEDRALNPDEVADVDAAAQHAARETNRAVILDRITADRSNLRTIASATSFNNAQRDDAIRLIARATLANGRAIEALAGRLAALDDTD